MILALAALLALAAPEAPAEATPDVSRGFAVLVSPPGEDAMAELVYRSAAELTAAGYTTRINACAPHLQPDCPSPPGADEVPLVAVVRFERTGAALVTELQILDGHGVRLRRRVGGERGDDPAAVAMHVVELVRASLLRATLGETGPAAAAPGLEPAPPRRTPRLVMEPPGTATPPAAVAASPPAPRREWHLSLGLGLAAWQSTGGVGPALGPMLQVGAGTGPWQVGIEAHVLPTAPEIASGSYAAAVQQEIGTLQLTRRFHVGGRLQLAASAGAGVYRWSIDARATAPGTTVQITPQSKWAAAMTAGADVSYGLGALELFAGARALIAQPFAIVRVDGADQATAAGPSFGVLAGTRLAL